MSGKSLLHVMAKGESSFEGRARVWPHYNAFLPSRGKLEWAVCNQPCRIRTFLETMWF